MFRRKKKPETPKNAVDKIVMGAIIGTAIGSVIGLTVAPKKGEETRENLGSLTKETATGMVKLAKNLFKKTKEKLDRLDGKAPKPEANEHRLKKIPNEMEMTEPDYQE